MKLFKVKDKSGRAYGTTTMNQKQLFNFVKAGRYEKQLISSLNIFQSTNEIPAVLIKRMR